jgi:outer membrane protein OmpA-like peptidoglycan-associated protein
MSAGGEGRYAMSTPFKVIAFVLGLAVLTATVFSYRRYVGINAAERAEERKPHPVPLVALPNQSTLVAEPGTPGRNIIDWLGSYPAGSQSFELGGTQFVGRTDALTRDSLGRATRLATILAAYPDIEVMIVGHTSASSDETADLELAQLRAKAVVKVLKDYGVRGRRLDSCSRGSSDPIAGTDAGDHANDRVSIVLTRRA